MNTRESGGVTDDYTRHLRRRFERLREATIGDVAEKAKINRDTVSAVFKGGGSPKSKGKVADALTEMEEEAGIDPAAPLPSDSEGADPSVTDQPPAFIRFRVEGVYGAKAIVMEARPENIAELEEMVDRVMRRLQAGQRDDTEL